MPGHREIWNALQAAAEPVSAAALVGLVGCSRGSVDTRLIAWRRNGYVERRPGWPPTYLLTDAARSRRHPPAMTRAGREVAVREPAIAPVWRAMRVLSRHGPFDVPLLALTAHVAPDYVQNYVNRLRRAGYVRLIGSRENWRTRPAAFRLIRDTGPKPPRVDVRPGRRTLIDPNSGERIDISPARTSLRSKPEIACLDGGEG